MSSRWEVKVGDHVSSRYGQAGTVEDVRDLDGRDPTVIVRVERGETIAVSVWDVIEITPALALEFEAVEA